MKPNSGHEHRERNTSTGAGEVEYAGGFPLLLFALLALFCHVVLGYIGLAVGLSVEGIESTDNVAAAIRNGKFFALTVLLGSLGFLACIPFAGAVSHGRAEAFMQARLPKRRDIVLWTLLFVLFLWASDVSRVMLNLDVVPAAALSTWQSCPWSVMPAYFAAIVVFAPVGEELFFRGFAFEGLRRSALGPAGAVLVTAALWAGLHMQYDLFNVMILFSMGILLGIVRLRTKSLFATKWLHGLNNAMSLVQIVVAAHVMETGGAR